MTHLCNRQRRHLNERVAPRFAWVARAARQAVVKPEVEGYLLDQLLRTDLLQLAGWRTPDGHACTANQDVFAIDCNRLYVCIAAS